MSHIQFADDTLLFVNNKSFEIFSKDLKLLLSIVRFDDQYGKKRRKIVSSRDRLLAGKLALFIHGGSPEISLWEPVLSDV